tara:strand:+ start:129 stop:245 length:117 start_codon:yes stop_codon:yes gene_type:complete
MSLSNAFRGKNEKILNKKLVFCGHLVAGVGFEPTTFRL